ncbi:MAG: glycosyltransferase family 39 protein [Gordonia paraffinivorans]
MPATGATMAIMPSDVRLRSGAVPVTAVAAATAGVLLLCASRYGYHRDELYFRICAQHLAWGYVDQPPVVPALARAGIALFGDSVVGLRVIPALIAAGTILGVALLARELSCGPPARVLAAAATAVSALVLQSGHLLSTTTFDVFLWTVIAVVAARILRGGGPPWFVALGAVVGVALLTKFTVALLVLALGAAVLVVGPRRVLRTRWLGIGAATALAVAAPTLVWQVTHGLPMLSVASGIGGADGLSNRLLFVPMQVLVIGPTLAPICVAGFLRLVRDPGMRHAAALGIAYPVAAATLIMLGGKFYYAFGLLLVLVAAGAQPTVDWMRTRARAAAAVTAIVLAGATAIPLMLPVLPARLAGVTSVVNPDQGEQIGWPDLVATVDGVWEGIPTADRPTATILTANYGEAGAVDRFGPALDLPQAYSGHMSLADRGPPPDPHRGPVLLVTGRDTHGLTDRLRHCRSAARITNAAGVDNTEHDGTVWICDPPAAPWSAVWSRFRRTS